MPATNTYDAIQSYTLTSNSPSVTFSSIPQTYTDLVVVFDGTNTTGNNYELFVTFNSDTGSNYSEHFLHNYNNTTETIRYTNNTKLRSFKTASTRSNIVAHFMNYSNTTTYKTTFWRYNAAVLYTGMGVGLWRSTAAINSITFTIESGNISSGSTFTLYGIKAA